IAALLLLLNSIIDLIGVAAIFPLFGLIVKPDFLNEFGLVKSVYESFSFQSTKSFGVALAFFLLAVVILKNVIGVLINQFQVRYIYDLYIHFSQLFYRRYQYLDFEKFTKLNSNIMQRDISHIPRVFATFILTPLMIGASEIVILGILLIGVILFDYRLLLVLFFCCATIYFILYKLYKNRITSLEERMNGLIPLNTKSIFDMIFGYIDIHVSNTFDYFSNTFRQLIQEESQLRIQQTLYSISLPRIVETSMIFALSVLTIYGLTFLNDKSDLTTMLGVFGLAVLRTIPSINRIMNAVMNIKGKAYAVDSILIAMDSDHEIIDTSTSDIKFNESIVFNDVFFNYSGSENQVLEGISVEIMKGEVIGLVGESGSGKSTFSNLILGLLKPKSGSILVDGIILNNHNLRAWQDKISYVQQNIFLIDDTIEANVCFGQNRGDIDKELLERSIDNASLRKLIHDLPDGLNSIVGDRGANLSGGQKQRIAIARALYKKSEVIILDEATSALDQETEMHVTETFKKIANIGITLIIISHRKSQLLYADKIFEFQNGSLKIK
ncbi:MAG: ABC transporter ATP-binding protein, partial [Cyclobacteriaceae bacterium]